jgi:hypothetical protein
MRAYRNAFAQNEEASAMPKRCGSGILELVCFQRSGKHLREAELMNPMNLADFSHGWWFSTSWLLRTAFVHVRDDLWISFKKYSGKAIRGALLRRVPLGKNLKFAGYPPLYPVEKP